MGILDRYIARVVLAATLMALFVVVGLDTFFSFVGEVADIGKGNYQAAQALQYIALTIPRRIHELFPMAALLGSLMGLGMLASNSELIAMRAAGYSIVRVIRAVLQVGVLMLLGTTLLGEFVAPGMEQQGQALREMALNNRITFQSSNGYWLRDGRQFIHIRQMQGSAVLEGVTTYDVGKDHRLEEVLYIPSARNQGDSWILEGARQSRFTDNGVVTEYRPQSVRDSLLAAEILDVVVLEPDSMSARELYRYVAYLTANGLESGRYRLALWIKLTAPLAGLVMLFLSVPFVFGSLRSVGAGQRLLVGVMVGIGFQLLTQTLSHLGLVYGVNPMISALTPVLLFLVLGMAALRRV